MHVIERILLYATAFVLALTLVLDRARPVAPATLPPVVTTAPTPNSLARPQVDVVPPKVEPLPPQESTTPPPLTAENRRSLVLVDDTGRPRIELIADELEQAKILLRSPTGETVLSLVAGADEDGEVVLKTKTGTAAMRVLKSGAVGMEVANQDGNGLWAVSAPDGAIDLTLKNGQGSHARLAVLPTGETEVSSGRADRMEALMRTDTQGSAEIAIRNAQESSEIGMSAVANGDLGLGIKGGPNKSRAVLQLLRDGSAEMSLRSEKTAGPQMLLSPEGISVISARFADGTPAASMVASPEGASVLAVQSRDGKNQASLRVDPAGKPSVLITDPTEQEKIRSKTKPGPRAAVQPGIGELHETVSDARPR